MNYQNKLGVYPLLQSIYSGRSKFIHLLVDYAETMNTTLELNAKDSKNLYYPYLLLVDHAMDYDFLIDYANKKNITLIVNDSDAFGNYPLLKAIKNGDGQMIKKIMEYAEEKNILLTLDKVDVKGFNCLLAGINKNCPEAIQLVLEYADKHGIILKISDKEIVKFITENHKKKSENSKKVYLGYEWICAYNAGIGLSEISEMKKDIFKLLCKYKLLNKLEFNITNESGEFYDEYKYHMKSVRKELHMDMEEEEENENSKSSKKENTTTTTTTTTTATTATTTTADNNNNKVEEGDLVMVLYDYEGSKPEELSINKNEYLIVTNWTVKDGWAYGYKKADPSKKGNFLIPLVVKCVSINN